MSMNRLYNAMASQNTYKTTENGAVAKNTTGSKLYDLFSFGAAYRQRTESDCVLLFKEAYQENPVYALKCLFYIRDIRGGQGERRFFRTCLHWLAVYDRDAVLRNLDQIAEYGRWDDLYALVGTSCEHEALYALGKQLALDYKTKGAISLAGKWAASENASSAKTKRYGRLTAHTMGLTSRQYRVLLSNLRERIRVLERLMSANRWNEIEFDKIPSRAGLIYKNAFARRDLIKAKYEAFAKDTSTKVNAAALYPYDVVAKAIKLMGSDSWYGRGNYVAIDNTDRLMINKYWENLTDYFHGMSLNALVVADTSGSMTSGAGSVAPIDVAVSLALYAAERNKGPFANSYISFSRTAKFVETRGVDFCDKVDRIVKTNLCENTNLQSVFDLVLNTAIRNHLRQADMPETIVIISDMEVDAMQGYRCSWNGNAPGMKGVQTFMDKIRNVWISHGYQLPKLVLWNVNARNNTVLDAGSDVSCVSGCSPVIFEMVMSGKTGYDLMMDKLNSTRYKAIH